MITKLWKVFIDYEKEEKWLNKKTAKGLAMTDYSPFCYTFEDCSPGKYIYRIELLKNSVTHPDSISYIQFMEDNGAEHIASHFKWVYFRRKAADGPFEIYSDLESRIVHYKGIIRLWIFIGLLLLWEILAQIFSLLDLFESGSQYNDWPAVGHIILGAVLLLEAVMIFRFLSRYIKKVGKLKRERDIRE